MKRCIIWFLVIYSIGYLVYVFNTPDTYVSPPFEHLQEMQVENDTGIPKGT